MTPGKMSETTGTAGNELIAIARIARPHGLRGEVVADILTDFPDRFAELASVCLRLPAGEVIERRLERSRLHQGRVVLKLAGVERIEETEPYRGATVLISYEQLIPLPPDSYYDFDLVDCQVVRRLGAAGATLGDAETPEAAETPGTSELIIGRVTGVEHFGAAPLLVVVTPEGREHLIPLAAAICVEVDVRRKRILVDPPEGLLD